MLILDCSCWKINTPPCTSFDEHSWQAHHRLNYTRIFECWPEKIRCSFSNHHYSVQDVAFSRMISLRQACIAYLHKYSSSVRVHVLLLSWTCTCACVELARGECGRCGGDEGSSMRVTSYPAEESPGSLGSPGEPGLFGLRSLSGLIREWLTSNRNRSSST